MSRAGSAAQSRGEPGDMDGGDRGLGVHLGDAGDEQHVDALRLRGNRVGGEVARISGEILVLRELQRVHEDRGDHEIVVGARGAHQ